MSNKLERQTLTLPVGHDKLLLHSCCAPCFGEVMETLIESGIDFQFSFTIPIFILRKNMRSVKRKISALPRNITFRLLTLTMTQTIGLLALKV